MISYLPLVLILTNHLRTCSHSSCQTPAAQEAHFQPTQYPTPNQDRGYLASTDAAPPASVTPGFPSGHKTNRSIPAAPIPTGNDAAAVFSTFEGSNERILPAEKATFEDNYAEFQRIIQDLSDSHKRGDSEFSGLTTAFVTAYADTLQDQGELSTILASLYELNSDLDCQIAEYDAFLESK